MPVNPVICSCYRGLNWPRRNLDFSEKQKKRKLKYDRYKYMMNYELHYICIIVYNYILNFDLYICECNAVHSIIHEYIHRYGGVDIVKWRTTYVHMQGCTRRHLLLLLSFGKECSVSNNCHASC